MARDLKKDTPQDFIKFLGTAGARFVMIKQLRASAGLWVSIRGTNVLIDPGPGSIVKCNSSRPKLDPTKLDAIILTHRHLDHCGDINVMIEAMTQGGFKKRGSVFCPEDAINGDPVIFQYARLFPEKIEIIQAGKTYQAGNFAFKTSMRHIHSVETYGLKFDFQGKSVGLLTDTSYFKELADFYRTDILIAGVVFLKPHPNVDHLSLEDIKALVSKIKPEKTVLTHFGMSMILGKPDLLAQRLSKELSLRIVSAYDGMSLTLD
jgi:phosphoribosyl 1,2-cyclic phosphodiesterase